MMDDRRQSMLPVLLVSQLEKAANRALYYAPLTRVQLAKLKGKSLALQLQRPNIPLLIEVGRRQLHFHSHWETPADVTITGPAIALTRQLGKERNTPADLMREGIRIDGDQDLAQQFMTVIKDLDLDLESALGDLVGDMAAHQITGMAKTGFGWLQKTSKSLWQNSRQMIVDDQKLVVKDQEFDQFQDQVEELRADTDRLQARFERIQSKLQPKEKEHS